MCFLAIIRLILMCILSFPAKHIDYISPIAASQVAVFIRVWYHEYIIQEEMVIR